MWLWGVRPEPDRGSSGEGRPGWLFSCQGVVRLSSHCTVPGLGVLVAKVAFGPVCPGVGLLPAFGAGCPFSDGRAFLGGELVGLGWVDGAVELAVGGVEADGSVGVELEFPAGVVDEVVPAARDRNEVC